MIIMIQVQEMERDNNLRSLKKARKKCVGLCYILRQKIMIRLSPTK